MAEGSLAIALVEDFLDVEEDWDEGNAIDEERVNRRYLRDTIDPFSCSEIAFRRYFRLSRELARNLCDWLRPMLQRQRSHGLSVEKQVLTAVRFFATGSFQVPVGQDLNICFSQPAVSRTIRRVAQVIVDTLLREYVKFATTPEQRAAANYKFINAPQPFEGAIGAIDCTHVAVRRHKEHDEHLYNQPGYHSLNFQMVCDPQFKFLQVCARFGGSRHDAFIWSASPLRDNMETNYMNGERHTFLLGDSGYPLEPWMMTPITDAEPGTPEFLYTSAHCKARSVVGRAFGILKGCWRCLSKSRVLQYKPEVAGLFINACVVIHNLRIEFNLEPNEEEMEMPDQENKRPAAHVDQPNLRGRRNVLLEARRIRTALVQRRFT